MNCPNCGRSFPQRMIDAKMEKWIETITHVDGQIDCATGEPFIPVARVVGDEVVPLWAEDYICVKRS